MSERIYATGTSWPPSAADLLWWEGVKAEFTEIIPPEPGIIIRVRDSRGEFSLDEWRKIAPERSLPMRPCWGGAWG